MGALLPWKEGRVREFYEWHETGAPGPGFQTMMGGGSGMIQGAIGRKILRSGSGKQIVVTGDKTKGRQILRLQEVGGHQSSCQLNGIVATQTVVLSQLDGPVNHEAVDRQDQETFVAILEEAAQGTIPLLPRDPTRRTVLGCQSSGYLRQSDLGQQDGVLSSLVKSYRPIVSKSRTGLRDKGSA